MSAVPADTFITEAEYLEKEVASLTKNEYYKGTIFPMAPVSFKHSIIVRNTLVSIASYLKDKNAEVFFSNLRMYVEANTLFTYPDLFIFSDKIQLYKKRDDTVTNPTVIIEVTVPETEVYDRGEKFIRYQDLPSLKEYILISSTKMLVEKFTKQPNGDWLHAKYKNPTDQFEIESIGFTITVENIYRKVDFNEE